MTIEKNVLVLCPPNMTAPNDGPKGLLGDRIHQFPAVRCVVQQYKETYIWPRDEVAFEVFGLLQQELPGKVNFLLGKTPEPKDTPDKVDEVIESAKDKVEKVICLYADPSICPPGREVDCKRLRECHEIALRVTGTIVMPENLDPGGCVPLWMRLFMAACENARQNLKRPEVPFLKPTQHQCWAKQFVNRVKSDFANQVASDSNQPVLIVSPISGAPKGTVPPEWWKELAKSFKGKIIVPVHETEIIKAVRLFDIAQNFSILREQHQGREVQIVKQVGAEKNVTIVGCDIPHRSGLAALPYVHVLGVDGGTMNVLAASSPKGALVIYGEWPASAWAMPNVVAREPDITPEEALIAVP